jgi:hypothetical protein
LTIGKPVHEEYAKDGIKIFKLHVGNEATLNYVFFRGMSHSSWAKYDMILRTESKVNGISDM